MAFDWLKTSEFKTKTIAKINTCESEMRPAGVEFQWHKLLACDLTGRMPVPLLQFDRFNFSDESLVVIGKERTDQAEHGVTEATDVHGVSSFIGLNRLVPLKIK